MRVPHTILTIISTLSFLTRSSSYLTPSFLPLLPKFSSLRMSSTVPADDAIFPPMELSDEERQQLISNYESVLEKSRAIGMCVWGGLMELELLTRVKRTKALEEGEGVAMTFSIHLSASASSLGSYFGAIFLASSASSPKPPPRACEA